jgi:uncharacterized protein involved in outer membrane biogenesis
MPTPSITTLRATIAAALDNPSAWSTFSFPPPTPIANSVIISPDDPYIVPSNNTQVVISPKANFKITCLVPALDNQGNLAGIESTVTAVFTLLANSGITMTVTQVSAPTILSLPNLDLLAADISITVLTSWS